MTNNLKKKINNFSEIYSTAHATSTTFLFFPVRSLCTPQFSIRDANGEVALRIEGPVCTYSICGDVEFQVLSPDGSTEVGKISKQWSGLLREAFTDADNFGISFPMDLVMNLALPLTMMNRIKLGG